MEAHIKIPLIDSTEPVSYPLMVRCRVCGKELGHETLLVCAALNNHCNNYETDTCFNAGTDNRIYSHHWTPTGEARCLDDLDDEQEEECLLCGNTRWVIT